MDKIKIVMCDIDGTLLNDEKKVTPKTLEAIKKIRKQGILFGIATGRTPVAVKKLLSEWHLEEDVDILMGFNGSQYFDFKLGKEEKSNVLEGMIIRDIIELYKDFDLSYGIFDEEIFHATRKDEVSTMIASNNKLEMAIDNLEHYKQTTATKMLAMGKKEVIDEVEKFYQDHQDSRYRGVRSTKNLFEFLEPHVSKSFGIERIAKNYECTLENVCVFGDELNDLEMIRDCGVGVCMANGNPTVKEIANYVTGSNNEDGIAEFIDKYLIKK